MKSKSLEVTIILPGLFAYEPEEFTRLSQSLPQLGALSRMLSRAKATQSNKQTYESVLGGLFGMEPDIPVAALTYINDKYKHPERYVLRVDPVYLKPDRDHLILLASDNLNIPRDDAQLILDEFQHTYSDCDWQFEMGDNHRWYLLLKNRPNISCSNKWEVFGKSIQSYLPAGKDSKQWHAKFNEFQMLLHSNTVNIRRESQGQLPINSLWIWGAGELPAHCPEIAQQWSIVWADDALCGGLAHWCQIPSDNLPTSADVWIQNNPQGKHLLVMPDLRLLARTDFNDWFASLESINQNWLEPLQLLVKKGVVQNLRIETLNGKYFTVTRSSIRAWWKKDMLWHQRAAL